MNKTQSTKQKAVASPKIANIQSTSKKPLANLVKVLPWILVICGIIGVIASTMITVEKFNLLENPSYTPVCDLNPIISCGNVMKSKQANAFGFMNTYIGLIGFPVVITAGAAMLAGARFKRWFWIGMQIGLTFGVGFAYWLLFESIYRIHALCPYCLSIDVAITTAWWYLTLYNFYSGNLHLPRGLHKLSGFIKAHHSDILVAWFLIVIAIILHHFWYYFGQHL